LFDATSRRARQRPTTGRRSTQANTFKHQGIMSGYSGWLYRSFESVFQANRLRGRALCGPAVRRAAVREHGEEVPAVPVRRHRRAEAIRAGLFGSWRRAMQRGRRFVRPGRRVRLPGRVIV